MPKLAKLSILVVLLLASCAMPINQPQTLPWQQAPAAQDWRDALGITQADTHALVELLAPKGPKVETEAVVSAPAVEMTSWERWYLAEAPQAPAVEMTNWERWYLAEAPQAPAVEMTNWERWYLAEAPQAPAVEMTAWDRWYLAEAPQAPVPVVRDQWYADDTARAPAPMVRDQWYADDAARAPAPLPPDIDLTVP